MWRLLRCSKFAGVHALYSYSDTFQIFDPPLVESAFEACHLTNRDRCVIHMRKPGMHFSVSSSTVISASRTLDCPHKKISEIRVMQLVFEHLKQ
jgi:hypothetical protein